MALVSPSLLAADFLHLDRDINMINHSEADCTRGRSKGLYKATGCSLYD